MTPVLAEIAVCFKHIKTRKSWNFEKQPSENADFTCHKNVIAVQTFSVTGLLTDINTHVDEEILHQDTFTTNKSYEIPI